MACVAGDCADVGVISAMLEMAEKRFGRSADLVVVNAGRGLNGLSDDFGYWAVGRDGADESAGGKRIRFAWRGRR